MMSHLWPRSPSPQKDKLHPRELVLVGQRLRDSVKVLQFLFRFEWRDATRFKCKQVQIWRSFNTLKSRSLCFADLAPSFSGITHPSLPPPPGLLQPHASRPPPAPRQHSALDLWGIPSLCNHVLYLVPESSHMPLSHPRPGPVSVCELHLLTHQVPAHRDKLIRVLNDIGTSFPTQSLTWELHANRSRQLVVLSWNALSSDWSGNAFSPMLGSVTNLNHDFYKVENTIKH